MKKVMVLMVAVVLSVSISAFAWAGCGGCAFNGQIRYGCYGSPSENGFGQCYSIMCSIESAAMRCCSGIFDFFKGGPGRCAVPGGDTHSRLRNASLGSWN